MVSQTAYLPLVFSPVARNRYTSPTRAIVRHSVDLVRVSWRVISTPFSRQQDNGRCRFGVESFLDLSHLKVLNSDS